MLVNGIRRLQQRVRVVKGVGHAKSEAWSRVLRQDGSIVGHGYGMIGGYIDYCHNQQIMLRLGPPILVWTILC